MWYVCDMCLLFYYCIYWTSSLLIKFFNKTFQNFSIIIIHAYRARLRRTIKEAKRRCTKNFPGVILASSLKWDKHVAHVSLKISRVIDVLYRLKHIFSREVLLSLYNTLILPHLSYCILVWGSKIDSYYYYYYYYILFIIIIIIIKIDSRPNHRLLLL